jgi:enoyl-CoA hydratase/carnithine racemase
MAVGIGVTILLHCDLVYAADHARLVMPLVNLGIVPEAGSTVLLPAMIRHQRAAELLMLGAATGAQRANELGLVNAVVAPEALLTTAPGTAQKLAEKPAGALLATKALLRRTGKRTFPLRLEIRTHRGFPLSAQPRLLLED